MEHATIQVKIQNTKTDWPFLNLDLMIEIYWYFGH